MSKICMKNAAKLKILPENLDESKTKAKMNEDLIDKYIVKTL